MSRDTRFPIYTRAQSVMADSPKFCWRQ